MEHTTSDNRRHSPRARISVAVKQQINGRTRLLQASNISPDGMFLAAADDQLAPCGHKCWLEFTLPGSDVPIKARGRVVRRHRYKKYQLTAVTFAAIAPSHRRLIARYVQGPPVANATPTFLPPPQYH